MIFINSSLIFSPMLKGFKKTYLTPLLFISHRNFFSSNYWCLDKKFLNEPLKSNKNSNLFTPESKEILSNNYKNVDSNNSTIYKIKNADSFNVNYGLDKVKCGFLLELF